MSTTMVGSYGPVSSRGVAFVTLPVTHGRHTRGLATKPANSGEIPTRRDGRVVDGGGLENLPDRLSQDGYISAG